MRPRIQIAPSPDDPFVALAVYLVVGAVVVFVLALSRTARGRTLNLLYVYLSFCVFVQLFKRLTHYQWYSYPLKFGLFFLLLATWAASRKGLQPRVHAHGPAGIFLLAYLILAAIQVFNPIQGNALVGVLGW